MVNGLGGIAGFGVGSVPAGDWWSASTIDLAAFYNSRNGLKYLAEFYSDLWIHSSGFIQFDLSGNRERVNTYPLAGGTPLETDGNGTAPIIAPFWSPVDTGRGPLAPSPGGNSTGANRVWYDLDETSGRLTVTWDDVRLLEGGPLEISGGRGVNAFQMELAPASGPGATSIDFDVTFRYESLGNTLLRHRDNLGFETSTGQAIFLDFSTFRAGAFVDYELEPSVAAGLTDPNDIQGLVTDSNVGDPGVWRFAFRQGWLTPEVTVENVTVTEGSGPGATFAPVTVRLAAGVEQEVTLTWTAIADTANPATDLLAGSGSVTFAPWQTERTVQVPITRDDREEGTETLTLRFSGPPLTFLNPGGAVLRDRDATITILDDEGFRLNDARALERDGSIVFTVTRNNANATATLSYETLPGTAAAGTDYIAATGTVQFGVGELSRQITIALRDDALAEREESFQLRLTGSTGTGITTGEATGTIGNDDGIVVDDVWVGTGPSGLTPFSIPIRVIQPLAEAITLNWEFFRERTDRNAPEIYFSGPRSGSIIVPAGSAGASIELLMQTNVNIPPITLRLTDPTGAPLLDGTARIDPQFMWKPASMVEVVIEDDPGSVIDAVFRVIRKTEDLPEVTLDWRTLPGFTFAPGSFNGPDSGRVLLAQGSEFTEVRIPLVSDLINRDSGPPLRGLIEFNSPQLGFISIATVFIFDNDVFRAEPLTLREDAGTASLRVDRTGSFLHELFLDWAAVPAPVTTGSSLAVTSGFIAFAAGSAFATLNIPLINDDLAEPTERYTIRFGDLATPANPAMLTILDDDGGPPTISATERVAAEPVSGSAMRLITLRLDKPSTEVVRVNWETFDQDAKAGTDYVAASGVAEFARGATTTTIALTILSDSRGEMEESLLLRFSNPENAYLAQGSVAFTIVAQEPAWSLGAVTSALENGGAHYFEIRRDGDNSRPANIAWALEPQGANPVQASDFVNGELPSGVARFTMGQSVARVSLPVAHDAQGEANEGFLIRLSDPSDGGRVASETGTGAIVNDDLSAPVFSISTQQVSLMEGDGGATFFRFTVERSGDVSRTDRVQWTTVLPNLPDAATGADLLDIITPRDLVFRPGETSQQITVRVAGDRLIEGDERFEVMLLNPRGTASIAADGGRATGRILSDDGRLIASAPAPQAEGDAITGASHVITLARTETLALAQNVAWFIPVAQREWLANGQAFQGIAQFAPGETGTSISIATRGDALRQADRQIAAVLQPDPTFKSGGGTIQLRIMDDDLTLSVRALGADKNEGAAGTTSLFNFLVAREGSLGQSVDVAWDVLSGFPWPADDMDFAGPTSGVVTLAAGVREAGFNVAVAGDDVAEDWEDFLVLIDSLSPLASVAPGRAMAAGLIRDDDGGFRRGSSASDTIIGLATNDSIDGEAGDDRIIGLSGDDLLRGNFGRDVLRGDAGSDTLEGGGDDDSILGGSGNDLLRGGDDNDTLIGEAGDDTLDGGAGADLLRGDAGQDSFLFSLGAGDGVDLLRGFQTGIDRILLDHAVLAGLGPIGQMNPAFFGAGSQALDADDRAIYHAVSGRLLHDPDGAGGAAATLLAILTPGTALAAGDVWVV